MNEQPTQRKKLIEVALPLEAINKAAAREKSIRHGHPSTLHLWWSRKPLAAARAVIFAQMVDDPSSYVDTLRSDPKLLRKAESILKARRKVWEIARETSDKAQAAGVFAPDPGPEPALDAIIAEQERDRLFKIIEDLVLWENTTNEAVLEKARAEIWQSWRRACAENADHPRAKELFDRHKLPAFHDPFAGGGALPLEAQRLGLESYASDLNPVAVLINKAMIEIPPRFAGRPPVNPDFVGARANAAGEASVPSAEHAGARTYPTEQARALPGMKREWKGVQGLAEDVQYYGKWMRDEAEKRIGHLYPKVQAVKQKDGTYRQATPVEIETQNQKLETLTVIAWLWVRTVKSPNPAFANVDIPLASKFWLSTKTGKETYIEPVVENGDYRFKVKVGKPKDIEAVKNGTRLSRGSFHCLMSNTPVRYEYIDDEANAGRMGARLMAVVAEGERARVYLEPTELMEAITQSVDPTWKPDTPSRGTWASNAQGRYYGFQTFGDYFTHRQLVTLTTFADLVAEAMEYIRRDALAASIPHDNKPLRDGGTGATAYAEAVALYLGLACSRLADRSSTICSWDSHKSAEKVRNTFARQGIAMTWDFAEANPFSHSSGGFSIQIN